MDEVSVRTAEGRLSFLGAQLAKNMPELETAPIEDGTRFQMSWGERGREGPVQDQKNASELRQKMLAWKKGLRPAQTPGAEIPEALRAELQQHGYWTP